MKSSLLTIDNGYNPLDIAELVMMDRDWTFERVADGELIAEVPGAWCKYNVWFNWQEECGGFSLSCSIENKFPKPMLFRMHSLLALVNQKLWLGHFDICAEDNTIAFRHSMLLQGGAGTSAEHLNQLLDIAISECERFYPAFQSVVWGGKNPADALEIAMFETIAEA